MKRAPDKDEENFMEAHSGPGHYTDRCKCNGLVCTCGAHCPALPDQGQEGHRRSARTPRS